MPDASPSAPSAPPATGHARLLVALAWGVHLYTALGLPLALLAVQALVDGDAGRFLLLNIVAVVIDASDGTLARWLRVKERVPFDGALLDNIVDFLTYAFLPALALPMLGLLPAAWAWVAAVPLLASGFQFCQAIAKTDQAFVGFPSYWNVLLLYLVVLQPPPALTVALLLLLSALVFVPIHYLYPSRTRLLRPLTVGLGVVWGLACVALALAPTARWAPTLAWASLSYVGYYVALSFVHHRRVHQGPPPGRPPPQ